MRTPLGPRESALSTEVSWFQGWNNTPLYYYTGTSRSVLIIHGVRDRIYNFILHWDKLECPDYTDLGCPHLGVPLYTGVLDMIITQFPMLSPCRGVNGIDSEEKLEDLPLARGMDANCKESHTRILVSWLQDECVLIRVECPDQILIRSWSELNVLISPDHT